MINNSIYVPPTPYYQVIPTLFYLRGLPPTNMIIVFNTDSEYFLNMARICFSYLSKFGFRKPEEIPFISSNYSFEFEAKLKTYYSRENLMTFLFFGNYDTLESFHFHFNNILPELLDISTIIGFTEPKPPQKIKEYSANHYIVTSFISDKSRIKESSPHILNLLGDIKISSQTLYLYESVLILYNSIIETVDTDNTADIVEYLTTHEFDSLLGKLRIEKNHYSTMSLFLVQIDSLDKYKNSVDLTSCYYNFPLSNLLINNQTSDCNFNYPGYIDDKAFYKIGIITSFYGPNYEESVFIFYGLNIAMMKLNMNNAFNGRKIVPIYCSITGFADDAETCISLFKSHKIQYIFGGNSLQLKEALVPYLEENEMLYYFSSESFGCECSSQVLHSFLPQTSYYGFESTISRLLNGSIAIIYTMEYGISDYVEIMTLNLRDSGINIELIYPTFSLLNDFSYTLTNFLSFVPSGCNILSMLKGELAIKLLFELFYRKISNSYIVFNMFIDFHIATLERNIEVMKGHYFWSSGSYNEVEDPNFLEYRQRVFPYLAYNDYHILHSYTMLNILSETVKETTFDTRMNSYKKKFKSPYGEIELYSNNYFYSPGELIYLEGISNGKIEYKSFYKQSKDVNSMVYSVHSMETLEYYYCSWNSQESPIVGSIIRNPVYIIGIIRSQTTLNSYSTIYEGSKAAAYQINLSGGFKGRYLKLLIYDEILTAEQIKNTEIFIGCESKECRIKVSKQIDPKPLFYTYFFLGEECMKNVFYIGGNIQQVIQPIFRTFNDYKLSSTVHLYNSTDEFSSTLHEISISYGHNKIDKILSLDISELSELDYFTDIASLCSSDPCYLLVELTVEQTIKVLKVLQKNNFSKKYIFICITLEVGFLNRMDSKLIEGIIFQSGFDVYSDTEIRNSSKIFSGLSMPDQMFHNSYLAVKLWISILSEWTDDYEYNRKLLYKSSFDEDKVTYIFSKNNYITRGFFLYLVENNHYKTIVAQSFQIPTLAFDWTETIYNGCYLWCDYYSYPEEAITSCTPYFGLNVIISLSGKYREMGIGCLDLFDFILYEYDKNGGLNGIRFGLWIYNDRSDPQIAVNTIQYLLQFNISTIALISGPTVVNSVISKYVSSNIFLILIGSLKMNFCENNVIQIGDHITMYDRLIDLLIVRDYEKYLIVSDQSDERSIYVKRFLERMGVQVLTLYYEADNTNSFYISSLVYNIRNEYKSGCTIFLGDVFFHIIFDNAFKELNMVEPDFHFVSFYTSDDAVFAGVGPFEAGGSYHREMDTEVNKYFNEKISPVISSSHSITPTMVYSYEWLVLALEVCRQNPKMIYDHEEFRRNYFAHELNSPIGKIKMQPNNILSRWMSLKQLNPKTRKFEVVYSTDEPQVAKAWTYLGTDPAFYCDFSSNKAWKKRRISTIAILLLIDLTGDTKEKEFDTLAAINMAVDEINNSGGLFNNKIVIEIKNTNNDPSEFISGLEGAIGNGFKAVFGGYHGSINQQSSEVYDTPIFFTGISYDDICYRDSISTYVSIQILIHNVYILLLESNKPFFLISSEDMMSRSVKIGLINYFTITHTLLSGEYIAENSALEGLPFSIQSFLPLGGFLINILWKIEDVNALYNILCNNNIRYPDYVIINILLGENDFKEINNECKKGSILLSPFFESLNNPRLNVNYIKSESFDDFLKRAHHRIGLNRAIEGNFEAGYNSIKMWREAVKYTQSFSSAVIRNYLYGIAYRSQVGVKILNNNNYLSMRVYSGQFNDNGEIAIIYGPESVIKPVSYTSLNTSGYYGMECDWSDDLKGEGYKIDLKKIVFIHQSDSNERYIEIYRMFVEDTIVNEINVNSGIVGFKIMALHYFYDVRYGYMLKNLRPILNSQNIVAIFGCVSFQCSQVVSNAVELNGPIFFSFAHTNESECLKYTIFAFPSYYSMIHSSISHLASLYTTRNAIYIMSIEDYSSEYKEHIIELFNSNKYTVTIILIESSMNETKQLESLNKCSQLVESLINRDEIFMMFVAMQGKQVLDLIISFTNHKINPDFILLVLFDYDLQFATEDVVNFIKMKILITSFPDNINTNSKLYLTSMIHSDYTEKFRILEAYSIIYTSLQLLKWAISESYKILNDWPSTEFLLLSLLGASIDYPGGGRATILKSHYMEYQVKICSINENIIQLIGDKMNENYYSSPTLLENLHTKCEFGKNIVLFSPGFFVTVSNVLFYLFIFLTFIFAFLVILQWMNNNIGLHSLFTLYYIYFTILTVVTGFFYLFTVTPTESNRVCELRFWLLPLSYDFAYGVLFIKIYRINVLMNNKNLSKVNNSLTFDRFNSMVSQN